MTTVCASIRPTTTVCLTGGKREKVKLQSKKPTPNVNNETKFKTLNERVNLPDNVNDYLIKAERVNGRAAMIGFTSAVAEELMTGNSLTTQFMDNIGITVSVIGLVIIGTASNPRDEGLLWGVFDRNAETVNGRLAMLGILSLFLSESLMPTMPLF